MVFKALPDQELAKELKQGNPRVERHTSTKAM